MSADPLAKLRERIDRARRIEPPARDEPGSDDPLEALEARLSRAAEIPTESGPLSRLLVAIRRARATTRPAEPPGEWNAGDDDVNPLEQLRARVRREAEWIGRRQTIDLSRRDGTEASQTDRRRSEPGDSLEAIVGREVLEMLADEPLPAERRMTAIEQTAHALDDPSRANLRAVLRALLNLER